MNVFISAGFLNVDYTPFYSRCQLIFTHCWLKNKNNGGNYLSLNCSTVCPELPPISQKKKKKHASTCTRRVFKSYLPVHMKTLKRWKNDSIFYRTCAWLVVYQKYVNPRASRSRGYVRAKSRKKGKEGNRKKKYIINYDGYHNLFKNLLSRPSSRKRVAGVFTNIHYGDHFWEPVAFLVPETANSVYVWTEG